MNMAALGLTFAGCCCVCRRSVPFSLWVGSLFVATLSYYTTDYMRQGQEAPEKRNERYVYDPAAGAPPASFSLPCIPNSMRLAHSTPLPVLGFLSLSLHPVQHAPSPLWPPS